MPWFSKPSDVVARALFEHAPVAMLMVDRTGAVQHLNAAAEILFGYSRDALVGQPVEVLVPDSLRDEHVNLRELFVQETAARPMGKGRSLLARHKSGRYFGVEVGLNPVIVGKEPIVIASILDISARQTAERRTAIVLRELAHRTKNLIAVIDAIARRVASVSPDLATFENEFAMRLRSLGASHDLLIQEDWRGVPIQALVEKQLDFVRPDHSAMHIDGPALLLSATACQNFGLGLHELATNAVKHGAFSAPGGTVDVRWSVKNESEPCFQFEWVERDGPPVKASTRKGFGFVILKEVVPTALGGTAMLDMASDGLRWSLKAPLDQVVAVDGE